VRAREARLRDAYAEWYPEITPGVWHNAEWLTEVVLRQQKRGTPAWALGQRPLSDEHFEFQGPSRAKSRQTRRQCPDLPART
jgi:hypothetical protein